MTLYFFSGLGADERAFAKIVIPERWKVVHIKWLEPEKEDNLSTYCYKVAEQINEHEDYSFIGLSFGGIVAVELAKILKPSHLILISSVSNRRELSFEYRLLKLIKLHKIVPKRFFTFPTFLTYWFFGVKSKEEKNMLRSIIKESSAAFIKWAVNEVILWKNNERPENIFHIHGNADRIFRIKNISADVEIDGGGHFMIYSKANQILTQIINELNRK